MQNESKEDFFPQRKQQCDPLPNQHSSLLQPQRCERLLGRSAEESILLNSYFASLSMNANSPASVILIRGDSGIGKTKIAETLRSHVLEDDGFFIRGKFDQLSYCGEISGSGELEGGDSHNSPHVPYSGIASAFAEYCSLLEQRGEVAWREVVQALKGDIKDDEGRLLCEAIPVLKKIITCDHLGGHASRMDDKESSHRHQYSLEQEEKKESERSFEDKDSFTESRSHRLNYLMKKFIKIISNVGDPIVLLIDDMQWADVSSLELLRTLILGAKNPFVFIFTYRPVESNHPFSQLIQELEHTRVSMTEILLKNLRKDSVRDLVANILSIDCRNNNHVKDLIHDDCDATGDNRNCASLANITDAICNITNGNPFFVRQQIIFWVDHGLISIDANQCWVWDIDKIKKCSVLGDMISTISEKIKKLPSLTQHALTICACIGSNIDLDILGLLVLNMHSPESSQDVVKHKSVANEAVSAALQEGLLVRSQDGMGVTFVHDSIQSAAYSLLEKDNQASFHLKLGRILQKNLHPTLLQRHFFTIANQLARGYKLISGQGERIDAAKIFLQAGDKSRVASAFPQAQFFFARGINTLHHDDWIENYDLCIDMYSKAAEAAVITGDYQKMDEWLNVVFDRSKGVSLDDQFRAYYINVKALASRNEMEAAVDCGLEALELVGVTFPSRHVTVHTLVNLAKTRCLMKKKSVEDLIQLPPIKEKHMMSALSIMHLVCTLSVSGKKKLCPLICFKTIQLNLKYGMSTGLPSSIAFYGGLLSRFGFQLPEAASYCEMASTIQHRLGYNETIANVNMLNYGMVFPFTKKLSDCMKPLNDGYKSGLEYGDLMHGLRCASMHGWVAFHSGQPLIELSKTLDKFSSSMVEYNSNPTLLVTQIYQQVVFNFLGSASASSNPALLKGDFFDFDSVLSRYSCQSHWVLTDQAQLMQIILAYFFGHFDLAWSTSERLHSNGGSSFQGFVFHYLHSFYRGLTALALYNVMKSRHYLASAKSCLKELKIGRKKSPINLTHQCQLLEAEYAASKKKFDLAEKTFTLSIERAASTGVLHEHALACEKFGCYYLSRNNHEAAYKQIRTAHKLYSKWGSRSKCALLKKRFPHLIEERRDHKKMIQQRQIENMI